MWRIRSEVEGGVWRLSTIEYKPGEFQTSVKNFKMSPEQHSGYIEVKAHSGSYDSAKKVHDEIFHVLQCLHQANCGKS